MVEADGDMGFDWLSSRDLQLSAHVSSTGRVGFAVLDGDYRAHGHFQLPAWPDEWVDALRRISQQRPETPTVVPAFDFREHLQRQREFSERTFGPGARTAGVVDHIRKELREIEADPADISEWIDVVILALDGAWRAGHTPEQIIEAIVAKQTKNEARTWPDWRTAPVDKAIEHDRQGETPTVGTCAYSDDPEPMHGWFGLSYSNYLVLQRTIIQSMPQEWQARLRVLLDEADEAFGDQVQVGGFRVNAIDANGKFIKDPLANYERGRRRLTPRQAAPAEGPETSADTPDGRD